MKSTLATHIGELLRKQGKTIALAESCTGGLVSDRITNVAGSSEYFLGGVIAYAYQAKVDLLGVSWETLNMHGAVSREVVFEMAEGARKVLKADLAAAVSGIAGPGGGTETKPVGLAWIALAAPDGIWAREFRCSGTRVENKAAFADAVLQMILDYLDGKR